MFLQRSSQVQRLSVAFDGYVEPRPLLQSEHGNRGDESHAGNSGRLGVGDPIIDKANHTSRWLWEVRKDSWMGAVAIDSRVK